MPCIQRCMQYILVEQVGWSGGILATEQVCVFCISISNVVVVHTQTTRSTQTSLIFLKKYKYNLS